MTEENLERQRARLARSRQAQEWLAANGIGQSVVDRFALGIKAPYRPRGGTGVVADALSFPIFAADGERLPRFAFLNMDGLTTEAPHPVGWGVGTPLSYWSRPTAAPSSLLVVPDVRTLWLLDQLLDAEPGDAPVLLTRSHGTDLPQDWCAPRFWSDWPAVTVLDDGARGAASLAFVARVAGRDVLRLPKPEGCQSWSDALRSGLSAADFMSRLARAESWPDVPRHSGDDGAVAGDFGFSPVNVATAFLDGRIYYPYLVEERSFQPVGRDAGSRTLLAQNYAVRVLRSDGRVLRVEELPSPRDAAQEARVIALSDGTRLSGVPAVSRFASWSFASIQRYVRLRETKPEALHRPLHLIATDVEAYLRGCVWLPNSDDFAVAVAYALATYVFQVFDAMPLLLINGPKASGKSEFAQALADLSCNGVVVGQASSAGLVRLMHEVRGLLVLDDLERIGAAGGGGGGGSELLQMLKVGYKRASGRKPVVDRSGAVVTLDFYGPKAVTNTAGVEPVLGSRMLRIETAPLTEEAVHFPDLPGPDGGRAQELRDELHAWGMARACDVHEEYRRQLRRGGRRQEIEAPLRAIATLAGGEFARVLDTAMLRSSSPPSLSAAERVRLALATTGASGSVSIQQLQLELAMAAGGGDCPSPESIGRALLDIGARSAGSGTSRVRLHGTLCRVVELTDMESETSKGLFDPLSFCKATPCASCRYVNVCASVLPALQPGKRRSFSSSVSATDGRRRR